MLHFKSDGRTGQNDQFKKKLKMYVWGQICGHGQTKDKCSSQVKVNIKVNGKKG